MPTYRGTVEYESKALTNQSGKRLTSAEVSAAVESFMNEGLFTGETLFDLLVQEVGEEQGYPGGIALILALTVEDQQGDEAVLEERALNLARRFDAFLFGRLHVLPNWAYRTFSKVKYSEETVVDPEVERFISEKLAHSATVEYHRESDGSFTETPRS